MLRKGNLAVFEVTISPKLKKPHPPKLVCMHVTSIPTCINFLSRFRSIEFFDDHGLYSPRSEREICTGHIALYWTRLASTLRFFGRLIFVQELKKRPEELNPNKLETYLSEEDFQVSLIIMCNVHVLD